MSVGFNFLPEQCLIEKNYCAPVAYFGMLEHYYSRITNDYSKLGIFLAIFHLILNQINFLFVDKYFTDFF